MFKPWIERSFSSLLDRLPSQCAVCRAWPSRPVCDACVTRFAPPVPRCAHLRAAHAGRRRAVRRLHPAPAAARRLHGGVRLCLALAGMHRAVQVPRRCGLGRAVLDLAAQCALGRAGARAGRPRAADAAGAGAAARARLQPGATSWRAGWRRARSTRRCCCARARRSAQSGLTRAERLRNLQRRLRARAPARGGRAGPAHRAGGRRDDQRCLAVRGRAGAARRRVRRTSPQSCWRAPTRRPDDNQRHVPHRPGRTRDPAQHRQRDPPRRQYRLHAAPGRAARLLDGRPAAAPRRPRLSRVRRGPAPCELAGAARCRAAGGRSACSR